jgi:hypothetical protein
MRKPIPRALGALLVLAAVTVFVAVAARRGEDGARVTAATSEHGRRFVWPRGSGWTYAVRWEAASSRTIPGAEEQRDIAGGSLFEGDVSVRSLGADGEGVTTLVVGLQRIRQYELRLGEADLIGDHDRALAIAALAGKETFVRVDDRGQLQSVAYHADEPASNRELLRHLVDMMRVTLPTEREATTWKAQEPTPNGLARVRYDDDGDALRRVRLAYDGLSALVGPGEADQRVTSKASIELDPRGVVRSIDDKEELDVQGPEGAFASRWMFTASLVGSAPFEVATVHADDLDQGTGEAEIARERQRGRDERLSQGWDLGAVEVELLVAGRGAKFDATFVPRAAAFVRLHPEACPHLVAWFEDDRLSDFGRQLTMDVLSAAGSDEAQAAMRQAYVTHAVTLSLPLRGALVQRFIFVPSPNPESARFVAGVYERARDAGETEVSFAAAATLGAIVEHMPSGDAVGAEIDRRLRDDLGERRSPEETVALLRGLGNAHTDDDLDPIVAFADDSQPTVREQVARSLQHFADPVATNALVGLASDRFPMVDRAAFRGLRDQPLDDGDWDRLARDVEEGRTSPYADIGLVDLIERRPDSGARARRILQVVLARTPDTSGTMELRERIESLLARGEVSSVP